MLNRLVLSVLAATLVCTAIGLVASPAPARAETTRRVFFSAVDAKGMPVTDLQASDLTLKEGGKDRTIATLAPATGNFQVSILVDDVGSGMFQGPVAHFLSESWGHADVAISLLNPQAMKVVDFTTDSTALRGGLDRLIPRGRIQQDGLQVAEAVAWAAKDLQSRKAPRPVILVITASGEYGTGDVDDFILGELKSSGAALHVVYVNGVDLGQVLSEGPKYSGGTQENAASTEAMSAALSRIADRLEHQYELTYVLPDGTRPNERLQLQTTRAGVQLIAPQRIPDK